MKDTFVFGAIGLGFVLLVLSGVWSTLFPATSTWTDEKAARRAEVQDRIHTLRFRLLATPNASSFHSHAPVEENNPRNRRDPVTLQAELEELTKVNDQLNAEFQSARDRPNTVAAFLKWSGISLAGLGIIGWYAVKQTA